MILFGITHACLLISLSPLTSSDVVRAGRSDSMKRPGRSDSMKRPGRSDSMKRLARNFMPQLLDLASHLKDSERPVLAREAYVAPVEVPVVAEVPEVAAVAYLPPKEAQAVAREGYVAPTEMQAVAGKAYVAPTEESPQQTKLSENQDPVPKIEYDNLSEFVEAEANNHEYETANPHGRAIDDQTARSPGMEVDLDELVEKVRERLLEDFRNNHVNESALRANAKQESSNQDKQNQRNEDYAVAVDNPQPFSTTKQFNTEPAGPSEQPKYPRLKKNAKPVRADLIQPLKSKRKEKVGQVIESHNLYQKVKLSKKRSKKQDSYEEYLARVKPKGDVFDMDEEDLNEAQNLEEHVPITTVSTTENVIDRIKYQNSNMNRKVTSRSSPTGMSDDNNINKPKRISRTTPHGDNYGNIARDRLITNDFAVQEFIGGWDDETPKGYQKPTEEVVMYPMKKSTRKIQTNMPIRQRYTLQTVNYYNKLPRIAEKYNFDEPLPEKDREEEKIKPLLKDMQNINGKVKIKVAPQRSVKTEENKHYRRIKITTK
ncbi:hypothetical protein O0L34_g10502 [Tuta absoluta]|nr:hypothetical protein O0L34_g10502 [Tuta absoluta]